MCSTSKKCMCMTMTHAACGTSVSTVAQGGRHTRLMRIKEQHRHAVAGAVGDVEAAGGRGGARCL